jgi:hypothetical protein
MASEAAVLFALGLMLFDQRGSRTKDRRESEKKTAKHRRQCSAMIPATIVANPPRTKRKTYSYQRLAAAPTILHAPSFLNPKQLLRTERDCHP